MWKYFWEKIWRSLFRWSLNLFLLLGWWCVCDGGSANGQMREEMHTLNTLLLLKDLQSYSWSCVLSFLVTVSRDVMHLLGWKNVEGQLSTASTV